MRLGSIAAMVGLLVLGLAYGNCQKKQDDGESALSSLSCQGALRESFRASYHPWLRTKCGSCHVANAPSPVGGGRGFGDKSSSLAFKDFFNLEEIDPPNPRVSNRALDPNHQPGLTGPQNASFVNTARQAWEVAGINYKNCMLASNGGQPPPPPVRTTAKPILRPATIKFNNPARTGCKNAQGVVVAACLLADADYARLTWNLGTDLMPDANNPNLSGVSFELEVAVADYSPDAPAPGKNYLYYHYRRPKLTNLSGSSILVNGLKLSLNGTVYSDGSTFTLLDQVVPTGSNLVTLNNQILAMGGDFLIVPGSDSVSVVFSGIGPTTQTGVAIPTFTQLFGAAGTLRNSCVACHGAGAPNVAAFNISTYAGVSAKVTPGSAIASRIILRMESTLLAPTANVSVMPPNPAVRVTQTEIDRVKAWINAGAKND